MTAPGEVTQLLADVRDGSTNARDRLIEIVYTDLRRMAAAYLRGERHDHTLQPTALVNEGFVRLFSGAAIDWRDRAHFFAVAATQMRRILVDHARTVGARKRGGGAVRLSLTDIQDLGVSRDEDLIIVDELLTQFAKVDPRGSQVVELRFFGGLEETEISEVLSISLATVKRDWRAAKAWLLAQLRTRAGERV